MFHFANTQADTGRIDDFVHQVCRGIDISLREDADVALSIKGVKLPLVMVARYEGGPVEISGKGSVFGDDDLCLSLVGRGVHHLSSETGRLSAESDLTIIHGHDGSDITSIPAPDVWYGVVIARAAIAPMVSAQAGKRTVVRADDWSSTLLRNYIEGLLSMETSRTWELDTMAAHHIRDLVAQLVSANDDGEAQDKLGDAMAARRLAAQRFVRAHYAQTSLTAADMAAELGVSVRYVAALFAQDGGFHNYLVNERLAWGYRMLTNPVYSHLKVIDIAFRCGFNSLTTFNRQFKTRYGSTPSDVRP